MKVELRAIRKAFGSVRANDGVNLTLEEGHIYGLLGENGAGKTTLMKILSGFLSFDSGEIRFDDEVVAIRSPAEALRHGVGMLQQDPLDFPAFSVVENFLLGWRKGRRLDRRRGKDLLRKWAEGLGFDFDPDLPVSQLTVGERQQLEIVRLLALGVKVLILDEPTTGISLSQRETLFRALKALAEGGKTVVLVSHKLQDIEELCSRVTILRKGKVVGELAAPYRTEGLVELMFGQIPSLVPRPQAALGDPVLELQDFCVEEKRLCLTAVTLSVRAGEVIGIAGVEGSGQRLFLQGCAGLRRPSSGRIFLKGIDMSAKPYGRFRSEGVAYLPANRLEEGLISGLTLTEHLLLSRKGSSFFLDRNEAREEMTSRIRSFRIVGEPETRVEFLSGGNQQRALLSFLPDRLTLLLMEHPTRGLDIESTRSVWTLLLKRREEGTAILFSSADLDEIVERSDRILVFSGGRMSTIRRAEETSAQQLGEMIGGRGL